MKYILYISFFLFSFNSLSQEENFKLLLKHAKKHLNNTEFDSALLVANNLLSEAKKADSDKYIITANYIIGDVNAEKNNIKEAFDYYFKALKLSKSVNNVDLESQILNKIGALYFNQKNYTEAKHFLEEELALKEKLNDPVKLSTSLLNVSMLYRRINEIDKAEDLLLRARKIAYQKKDTFLLGNYFNVQASHFFSVFLNENKIGKAGSFDWKKSYNRENLRDSAEVYWQKSLDMCLSSENKQAAITPLFNLGYVSHTKSDFSGALKNYLLAKDILGPLGSPEQKATLFGNLAEVYYDLKDYKNASDFFRRQSELKDSLRRSEAKDFNLKLSKQYQLETNRKVLQQQSDINLKNIEIAQQQKTIYIYILLFAVLFLIVLIVLFYLSFNKRLTKKINEAKEKFFTNIVHEIRTPLSMIQAPLKTLRPKLTDDEGRYYIDLAEKNIVRLNELINQMLDVSKMESSTYKLNQSVGDLGLFLKELIVNYEKLSAEKNINFVSEVNQHQVLLVFDKDALEKIISNLLSNAIKYTSANGTVGLNINLEDDNEHAKLIIEVWDTGIGIAKNEQDKVFARFFRSEKSLNKASGVGIGLSLVQDLVNAYKGKISFVSEENKGSKFTVLINLKHPEQAKLNVDVDAGNTEKPLVLIIEDDNDIIEFMSNFLTSKGMAVVKAVNGNVAKAVLKNISPDIILTDLMMDELDGLSFIKDIRSNKGLNHIPVIVLSAKSSSNVRVEALNAGAQAFMSKPFLPEEVYSVINNNLALIEKIKTEVKDKIVSVKPNQTAEEKFSSTEPYTQKLFELVFKNLDNSELSVESLADMMATNRSHFQRKIKNLTGFSPSEIIKLIRLEKSKEFLLAKKGNITEVAYMCGFSSQSYFTKCFTQQFGYSPTQIFERVS